MFRGRREHKEAMESHLDILDADIEFLRKELNSGKYDPGTEEYSAVVERIEKESMERERLFEQYMRMYYPEPKDHLTDWLKFAGIVGGTAIVCIANNRLVRTERNDGLVVRNKVTKLSLPKLFG